MINLLVDEAFAFDYLAILAVKIANGICDIEDLDDCMENLMDQLGIFEVSEILCSQEYIDLSEANAKTFRAVEKARYGEITAKEVDDCNMERYNAKKALQEKFFSKSSQVEKKS